MAKAIIINVKLENNQYFVEYSTGTIRKYPADKAPKTVLGWLDENSTEDVVVDETPLKSPEYPVCIDNQIVPVIVPRVIPHTNKMYTGFKADITQLFLIILGFTGMVTAKLLYILADLMMDLGEIAEVVNEYSTKVVGIIKHGIIITKMNIIKFWHYTTTIIYPFVKEWWITSWNFRAEICLENRSNEDKF